MSDIGVLVVEDEPVAADAHCAYVERVPGFVVRGVAYDGAGAIRMLGDPSSAVVGPSRPPRPRRGRTGAMTAVARAYAVGRRTGSVTC